MNNQKTVLLVLGIIGLISAVYGITKGQVAEQMAGLMCALALIYGYFASKTDEQKTPS